MDLNNPWISVAAGLLCGIISGFGIGGGSILMVWMTAAAMLDQRTAQGINLLYFIPTSLSALFFHIKNKQICWRAVLPAAAFGCLTAAGAAWFASSIQTVLLRKLFGCFLILIGLSELLKKDRTRNK